MIPENWAVEFFILAIVGSLGGPYLGLILFDRMSERLRRRKERKRLKIEKRRRYSDAMSNNEDL